MYLWCTIAEEPQAEGGGITKNTVRQMLMVGWLLLVFSILIFVGIGSRVANKVRRKVGSPRHTVSRIKYRSGTGDEGLHQNRVVTRGYLLR